MRSQTSFLLFAFFVIGTLLASRGWTKDWLLEFPPDQEHGTVEVYERPTMTTGYLSRGELISAHAARGTVSVPDDKFVNLKLNGIASHRMSLLARLPAESINSLEISQITLSSLDFKLLSRFSHLRSLSLRDCTLAGDLKMVSVAFSESVEALYFDVQEDSQIDKIACWGAKSPRLSFVLCDNRHFNATEISHFANHPHAAFLPVQISSDAAELFASLKTIPNLVGLNLVVQPDASDGWWQALPTLKRLEHINWSGGTINDDLLSSLAQMQTFRSLVIQGSTKLAADFPQGLVKLTNLENLVLHQQEAECDVEDIYVALPRLKRLKSWPALKSPSRATLRGLSSVGGRTAVEIDGLGTDATQDDLLSVLSTHSLTSIQLRDVVLSPEIAAAICNNTQLEYLGLTVPEFDGLMFEGLDQLSRLDHVSLSIGGEASNLRVLCELAGLEDLDLNCYLLMPRDLDFIADCPALQSLEVTSGFSDDSTAKIVGESATLQRVSLLQDCYMTDAAIDLLCNNKNLESLSISGLISKQAALKLKDLPRLTWLTLWSDSMSDEDRESLKTELRQLTHTDFREFLPSSGKFVIGQDEIWRLADDRQSLDALEGKLASEIFPADVYQQLSAKITGKVVLVEFWGTWCGPCLAMHPLLKDLHLENSENDFVIVAIHSTRGSDAMDAYLAQHAVSWINMRDEEDRLAKAFGVTLYPSIFLIDRQGVLRVAQPHRVRLWDAVEQLVDE